MGICLELDSIHIDREELVGLALSLGNIDSPSGNELHAAEFVYSWLDSKGFETKKIGMFEDRFNVLGTIRGTGTGYSLIFNSHLDTAAHRDDTWSIRNPDDAVYHSAWQDGDLLVGEGVANDKGPMAAFLVAAKAIRQAGVDLKGDLLVSAVAGEIGREPIDEFAAPHYLSKEVGARYLIQHGGVADFALVAEGTNFKTAWTEAGKAFFKITVFGDHYYTPFSPDVAADKNHPNAIVRAGLFIPRIQEWGRQYEKRFRYESGGGTIVPKVTIGAVRGGTPYQVTRTSEVCSIYVDVRLVPDQDPLAVKRELIELLSQMDIPGEVELYLYRRSFAPDEPGFLLNGLRRAHRSILEEDLGIADPPFSSMWRDVAVFNEMGIPAVTYGPGVTTSEGLSVRIEDLYAAARVYAALAVDICTHEKPIASSPQS